MPCKKDSQRGYQTEKCAQYFYDKIYTGKDIKFITRNGDNLYYSVPMNFKTSSNLYLLVTTRDTIYNVILKEVNDE